MLVKEFYKTRQDGVNLYRTYSDENFKIRQIPTNEIYDEAIDIEESIYTYEETDIPIEDEDEAIIEDYEETDIPIEEEVKYEEN